MIFMVEEFHESPITLLRHSFSKIEIISVFIVKLDVAELVAVGIFQVSPHSFI